MDSRGRDGKDAHPISKPWYEVFAACRNKFPRPTGGDELVPNTGTKKFTTAIFASTAVGALKRVSRENLDHRIQCAAFCRERRTCR
jgi:hypothetical protein